MKWLLCDYGGVLCHHQPVRDREALAAAAGNPNGFRDAYWEHRPVYDRGDVDAAEYWRSVIGGSISSSQLQTLITLDVTSWLHENLAVLEAAERVMQRGYRLAILSNAPLDLANTPRHAPWLSLFDPCLFSCDLGEVKPAPSVYEKALMQLQAEPLQVVFFGDRIENVEAAAARGIQAYHFRDAYQVDTAP